MVLVNVLGKLNRQTFIVKRTFKGVMTQESSVWDRFL